LSRRHAKKRAQAAGYEPDTPRCATCKHFRSAGLHLSDSTPHFHHARCMRHDFKPDDHGCCNTWEGKDGSTLESKT